jgi:hypothetical protein
MQYEMNHPETPAAQRRLPATMAANICPLPPAVKQVIHMT